jgi:GNAT superfamily N-acetyltransferase
VPEDAERLVEIHIFGWRNADKSKADVLELGAIYVDPVFMREGVGAELLDFFEKEGRKRGAGTLAGYWPPLS